MQEKKSKQSKVVIFNGCPSSGKDTFGAMLKKSNSTWRHREFKTHLINITRIMYEINECVWEDRYLTQKEIPWDRLQGLSQRQALIKVSEEVIKPNFGKEYFGRAIAKKMYQSESMSDNYYLTDGGFPEELQPIVDKLGSTNVLVIRLHREGFTFEGDSRDFLKDEDFPDVKMVDVKSDDVNITFAQIKKITDEFIKEDKK